MLIVHVVVVIDSLAGGGAEKVMLTLLQTLQQQGQVCTLILLDNARDYTIPDNLDVRCFNAKKYWTLKQKAKAFKPFVEAISQEKGEIGLLLSNLDKSNRLVSTINHPKSYYVVHNSVTDALKTRRKHPMAWLRMRRAIQSLTAKRIIAVSHGVKEGLAASTLAYPASVTTIYNPVNIDEVKALANAKQGSLPSKPYLIHVGRVAKQKRHDVLFEALSKTQTDIDLVCLCRNVKKARRIAQRYGVEDRVIFPSFQQNPYPWIKQAKALVLSSDFEGFAMVLVESLVCETPVISTDCNYGPREILTGPLAQKLVPVGDVNQLAAQMDIAASDAQAFVDSPILSCIEAQNVARQYLALAQ
ncbi:glycosyltransferase [Marinagarivorans algicola]|uniref:glycosyltransferase n=1 Tax=Marinagarivorans algicola TaxID=1513270 RepID=UPI0006B99C7D|nr:glycosyltransferase [Marinagarivorans algicola]